MKRKHAELTDDPLAMAESLTTEAKSLESQWKTRLEDVVKHAVVTEEEINKMCKEEGERLYGKDGELFRVEGRVVGELVKGSVRTGDELEFAEKVAACGEGLNREKEPLKEEIAKAKAEGDTAVLRRQGSRLNTLSKLQKSITTLDKTVGTRLHTANKRLALHRAATPIRGVPTATIPTPIPPTITGYNKILDFYRHTDAAKYSFGRQPSGPQHFTDIRRNIAILKVTTPTGEVVFNEFAVSGEDTPGCNKPGVKYFTAITCEDGLGESYDRSYDAEYKLVSAFAHMIGENTGYKGDAVLWSKKPLCKSCEGVVVNQFPERFPDVRLEVVIDDES